MTRSSTPAILDRDTRISDLAHSVRRVIASGLVPMAVLLAVEVAILWFAVFTFLSGLAQNFEQLFAARALMR